MDKQNERRRVQRQEDGESGLAVAIFRADDEQDHHCKKEWHQFVGIQNMTDDGMLLELNMPVATDTLVQINRYVFDRDIWQTYFAKVIWSEAHDKEQIFRTGVAFTDAHDNDSCKMFGQDTAVEQIISNMVTLLKTEMITILPRNSLWAVLGCLVPMDIADGECFIIQDNPGESLYLIQEGSCKISVEHDGEHHQIASLGAGDIVGEMTLLTDEPRHANVIATSKMTLWQLPKEKFNILIEQHHDLRVFLTELITKRLEGSHHTAERTIGKYLIKNKLGHGAWAIVYQGQHTTLHKRVAIKMLKHQMAMDEVFHVKFMKEAEIIAQMSHRNILHIYDIEDRFNTLFIVMEFLEGDSLEGILKRQGAMPAKQAAAILTQVCSGLAYAHNLAIVHQDIKPDNIFIEEGGVVKILDFGLACPVGSENFEMEGTIEYMSPEQIDSYPVDARTDIYCLGITAFEMVTGRRPYPEEKGKLHELMDLHLNQDIPHPSEFADDIPPLLADIIIKCCHRDQGDRYQSVTDLLKDLQILNRELGNETEAELENRKMSSLLMFYNDDKQTAVTRLLEEMSAKAAKEGITFKLADFN